MTWIISSEDRLLLLWGRLQSFRVDLCLINHFVNEFSFFCESCWFIHWCNKYIASIFFCGGSKKNSLFSLVSNRENLSGVCFVHRDSNACRYTTLYSFVYWELHVTTLLGKFSLELFIAHLRFSTYQLISFYR